MDAWVSVYDLLIDGVGPNNVRIAAEVLAKVIAEEGVYKYAQFDTAVKVDEAPTVNLYLKNYVDACLGSSYDDRGRKMEYEDPECSPFNPYGWPQDRLPKRLRQTSISMHEERLRRAIELGFNPPSNFYGRLDGVGPIAEKMDLTRQALSKSLKLALEARNQDRKNAAVLHNTSK